jgi:broad specificity phosphatase PhoE
MHRSRSVACAFLKLLPTEGTSYLSRPEPANSFGFASKSTRRRLVRVMATAPLAAVRWGLRGWRSRHFPCCVAAGAGGAALGGTVALASCSGEQGASRMSFRGRWAWEPLDELFVGASKPSMVVASLPVGMDFCNDGDALVSEWRGTSAKVIWHVRHGESEGNVAKHKAQAMDKAAGTATRDRFEAYLADPRYVDAPLSPDGVAQARRAAEAVALWKHTPTLIVASPMTRALQTASIIFEAQLEAGTAKLVIRPELREFFSRMQESRGRPISELQACPRLQKYAPLQVALREAQNEHWAAEWDRSLATGDAYVEHVESPTRIEEFRVWLANRPERRIATVSHWGTINNLLNREPWADARGETRSGHVAGKLAWPDGGLARTFEMPNAGWVAVVATDAVRGSRLRRH